MQSIASSRVRGTASQTNRISTPDARKRPDAMQSVETETPFGRAAAHCSLQCTIENANA
jgi:hypothetical protein